MKPIHHNCAKCGKLFTGRARRKFCSQECARKMRPPAWNKGLTGLAPNRKPTGETRKCEVCNGSFYVQQSRAGRDRARYCSHSCYASKRWSNGGKCLSCGKPAKSRYCSKTCQAQTNARRKQEAYWTERSEIIRALGGKCRSCGIADIRVLELNHIDPEAKVRPEDGVWSWSRRLRDWRANTTNLEVLCANCHRLHTWEQRGLGVGLSISLDK